MPEFDSFVWDLEFEKMKECCGRMLPSGKSHDDGIVGAELNHTFFFGVFIGLNRSAPIDGDW
jgi:hypothetical protein